MLGIPDVALAAYRSANRYAVLGKRLVYATDATYTPPPYFPQSSLAPPDKNRYRKFKLVIAGVALLLVLLLGAAGYAIWYLIQRMS